MKKIEIKEFREKGYLQELNRRFLHPLGLALEIVIDEEGNEYLGGIWDYREDVEGIYYNISNSDKERKERFLKNKNFIDSEFEKRKEIRTQMFGDIIEKIND